MELEAGIQEQLDSGTAADPEYWQAVLKRLALHKAKARLREIHTGKRGLLGARPGRTEGGSRPQTQQSCNYRPHPEQEPPALLQPMRPVLCRRLLGAWAALCQHKRSS